MSCPGSSSRTGTRIKLLGQKLLLVPVQRTVLTINDNYTHMHNYIMHSFMYVDVI